MRSGILRQALASGNVRRGATRSERGVFPSRGASRVGGSGDLSGLASAPSLRDATRTGKSKVKSQKSKVKWRETMPRIAQRKACGMATLRDATRTLRASLRSRSVSKRASRGFPDERQLSRWVRTLVLINVAMSEKLLTTN
ncbi:hypothetical protein [Nostoc sp.]|uniref:hypothetical protein n=1 Tax=Nostoc sp. TaxID=1180 RepID=UPI002FFBC769